MTEAELQMNIMRRLQAGPMSLEQLQAGAFVPSGITEAVGALCAIGFVVKQINGKAPMYHAARKMKPKHPPKRKRHVSVKEKSLDFVSNSSREYTTIEVCNGIGAERSKTTHVLGELARAGLIDSRRGLDSAGKLTAKYWRRLGLKVDPVIPASVKLENDVLEVISAVESSVNDIAAAIGKNYAVTYNRVKALQKSRRAFIVDKRGCTYIWSSKKPNR